MIVQYSYHQTTQSKKQRFAALNSSKGQMQFFFFFNNMLFPKGKQTYAQDIHTYMGNKHEHNGILLNLNENENKNRVKMSWLNIPT